MVKNGWSWLRMVQRNGRLIQLGWLLFMLCAVSLALAGIASFHQNLETVCNGPGCLIGQLTPGEQQVAFAAGYTMERYAGFATIIHLSTYSLLILLAFFLILRKPTHLGAVSGAFFMVALGTSNLMMAASQNNSALVLPARLVQIIQLSTLLPFFGQLPDGSFRPGWLRWLALALFPINALLVFGMLGQTGGSLVVILTAGLVLGSLIYRYRSLSGSPKQESVAWAITGLFLLAGADWMGKPIKVLPLPAVTIDAFLASSFEFFLIFGMLLVVAALTCLVVALLAEELFRVDVALNRAIVYSFLTMFVVVGYVLVVGYLSLIFQSSGSLWFSLVATGVMAMLFQPIRERVQRFVNRIIYGEQDDPYTILAKLGQRLETAIASEAVIPTILQTVKEALKVSYAAITLTQPGEDGASSTAEQGSTARIVLNLPLVYHNETMGYLQLGPPGEGEVFSAPDQRLLSDLVRQAGAAIHATRQTVDLKSARERLVIAQEEERRRIQRDLHDGLGASLAALNLQAGEVQRLMVTDPEAAGRRIADLRTGLRTAVGDTRRLVYGLRPPVLDELGLLEALRFQIAQYQGDLVNSGNPGNLPIQVRFDAPEVLPELPAAVEVAIYRIVEEGLANIIHHAQAKNGMITLSLIEPGISIDILDDGVGLPEIISYGIGLKSLRERASELSGTWSIQSMPGRGTHLSAWMPLTSKNREE